MKLKVSVLLILLAVSVLSVPTAFFTNNPVQADIEVTMYFDASQSTDNVTIQDYLWSFGDGTTSAGIAPQHTYTTSGNMNVTLNVTNVNNESSIFSKIIIIGTNSLNTVMEPTFYPFQKDSYGFITFEFQSGYYGPFDQVYCLGTTMDAVVQGKTYEVPGFTECKFAKSFLLPVGTYNITFHAYYNGYPIKTKIYEINIPSASTPEIVIYSPKQDENFRQGSLISVESVAMLGGRNFGNTNMTLYIIRNNATIGTYVIPEEYPGVFRQLIPITIEEGNYDLLFNLSYAHISVTRTVPFSVNNSPSVPPQNGSGNGTGNDTGQYYPYLNILYPPATERIFEIRTLLPIHLEFFDIGHTFIHNALINATITKESQSLGMIYFTEQSQYYYNSTYPLDESGVYEFTFYGSEGSRYAVALMNITVPAIIDEDIISNENGNLSLKIIIPKPDVYSENTKILVRAKFTENSEPVGKAANLTLYLNKKPSAMNYDRFGEYISATQTLQVGRYEVRVIAEYNGKVLQDSVYFAVSEHGLSIEIKDPSGTETYEIEEGQKVPITIDVFNEMNDVVFGALIVADIMSPGGKTTTEQIFQNTETGEYESVYYPDEDGTYKMKITASKDGYVGTSKEITFTVKIKGKDTFAADIDFKTALTVILVIAILIIVIAVFRAVF